MARYALLICVLTLVGGTAVQADWFDWTNGIKAVLSDPNDTTDDGKEILGFGWGRDGSYDYFKMELAAIPDVTDYADIYGLYIFSQPGATPANGAPSSNAYVPGDSAYDGVDQIIDAHANSGFLGPMHYHTWYGGGGPGGGPLVGWYTTGLVDGVNFQQLTSTTGFEWRVPLGVLPNQFCVRAATMDPGAGGKNTYDITGKVCTPEPGTWALLALGIPAALWFRRRKAA